MPKNITLKTRNTIVNDILSGGINKIFSVQIVELSEYGQNI